MLLSWEFDAEGHRYISARATVSARLRHDDRFVATCAATVRRKMFSQWPWSEPLSCLRTATKEDGMPRKCVRYMTNRLQGLLKAAGRRFAEECRVRMTQPRRDLHVRMPELQ
jgi:hypothetical protein